MELLKLLCFVGLAFADQIPLRDAPTQRPLSDRMSKQLLALHKSLVKTESISGNELKVGKFLTEYLEKHDWTVQRQKVAEKRYNILAYPGKSAETKILVTSHIDTVPPFIDYSVRKGEDGSAEIWGRGTVDAKACVAAQTIAALDLIARDEIDIKSNPLALLFVVGEEVGGDGMRHFSDHKPTNYSTVIFGEPTEMKLAAGHKGLLSMNINIKGRAAHSGYPWLGVSANEIMVRALGALVKLQDDDSLPRSEKYGSTTLNIGKLQGGVAANVVAKAATASVALRLAAGEPSDAKEILLKALEPVKKLAEDKGGELEVVWTATGYGPVPIDTDVDGFDTITVNYGTDVPNLAGDHKRYLYGPGTILVAHSDDEHLKVSELEQSVQDYQKLIMHALQS